MLSVLILMVGMLLKHGLVVRHTSTTTIIDCCFFFYHWNVKTSYSEIAKKIGIDEETARIRIQSLKQSGFLLGWRLILNANLIDRESNIISLYLNYLMSKRRIEQSLKLAEWRDLS